MQIKRITTKLTGLALGVCAASSYAVATLATAPTSTGLVRCHVANIGTVPQSVVVQLVSTEALGDTPGTLYSAAKETFDLGPGGAVSWPATLDPGDQNGLSRYCTFATRLGGASIRDGATVLDLDSQPLFYISAQ